MRLGKIGSDAQDRLRFRGGSRKVVLVSQRVGEIQVGFRPIGPPLHGGAKSLRRVLASPPTG